MPIVFYSIRLYSIVGDYEIVKDKIDTRKKWRLSYATDGVYYPGYRFGHQYVEGNYKDPEQRVYRDYGSRKQRALKEASPETFKKLYHGSGYSDEEKEEIYKHMDQKVESYYRKNKKVKKPTKRTKKCKCK